MGDRGRRTYPSRSGRAAEVPRAVSPTANDDYSSWRRRPYRGGTDAVLLLDEPSAGPDESETETLAGYLVSSYATRVCRYS